MNLGLKIFVKLSWTLCYWIFTSQNFRHTTSEAGKRTTPVITKKGNYGTRKVPPQASLGCAGKRNVYKKG